MLVVDTVQPKPWCCAVSTTNVAVVELIDAAGIAELIGVSRQRVDKIAKTDPAFPQPVARLRRIRVWDRADVERWAREAGRPRRAGGDSRV